MLHHGGWQRTSARPLWQAMIEGKSGVTGSPDASPIGPPRYGGALTSEQPAAQITTWRGKLCTFTQQAGCLIPDLLDLRVQERLGWREVYPASIFDTYAATAKRTTRSRMIMTFESVCGWSKTCRVDAQRLRLKPRDRLTTENALCTRQPRTRKGWGARAGDSIVPRSEMARRRARGTLSRGAPRSGSKKE